MKASQKDMLLNLVKQLEDAAIEYGECGEDDDAIYVQRSRLLTARRNVNRRIGRLLQPAPIEGEA